jgi:glutathione S-transferase
VRLYFFETPTSRKACAAARYLGLAVELVRVDLSKDEQRRPAFLAINPNGKVPTLEDGATRLWESDAIMCYLADKAGSDLWPKDARQIDVIRWLSWNAAHFSRHAGNLFFQHVVKPHLQGGRPDPAVVEESTGFFLRFAAVLDEHLKGRRHIVGDGLTVADFAVGAFLPHATEAKIPVDRFPEINRWYAGLEALPAWREPFATTAAAA